jgi:hypothetical protein
MRGLDPRICRWPEMAGSSPGHDGFCSTSCADLIRASAEWKKMAGSLPGHDVVGEARSEAFAGMTISTDETCGANYSPITFT